jgi:hypothetical protein
MAGKGGRMPGAGRKKGSVNRKTREIANKAAESGITPLEVMIQAMREVYEKDGAPAAVPFAKECAPYMHPKISNIELTGKNGGPVEYSNLSDSELDRRLNSLIGHQKTE